MPDRLRVLIVMPWGERLGGAEAMLWTLLGATDPARVAPAVATLAAGPFEREIAATGAPTHVVGPARLREPRGVARTVARIARILERDRPDIVLNWSPKAQLFGAPAAMRAGIGERVVWWQHGVPERHWLDRLATALPARAVGCSSEASARAQERLRPRRAVFVAHPGIEPPPTATTAQLTALRARLGIDPTRRVVGIVGRLQPWKGQDRVIRAIAALRERGMDAHGLIVGGEAYGLSRGSEAALRDLATELGVADAVAFAGQVEEPGAYVQLMDVMVSASDPEPFGIVLVEAMALGVPVVAVASGGPLEIVEPERSGLLVPAATPELLAAAAGRVLEDAELAARLAAGGRERYAARFTAERMAATIWGRLAALAPEADPS